VFWFPFTIIGIIAGATMSYVLFKIWWVTGVPGLSKHWRLAVFMLYGVLALFWASVNHWAFGRAESTRVTNALTEWLVCLATHLDQSQCYARGHVPGGLNYAAFVAAICISYSTTMVFALVLLSDPEIPLHWYDSFRRYVLRQKVPDRWASHKRALKLSNVITSRSNAGSGSDSSSTFMT